MVAHGLQGALVVGALAAFYGLSWLAVAPNRLLPGQPVSAVQAIGPVIHGVGALTVAAALLPARRFGLASLVCLGAALALMFVGTGAGAKLALQGHPPAARAMLGAGFWCGTAALVALAVERARRIGFPWAVPATLLTIGGLVVVGSVLGWFEGVSLMVEYRARLSALSMAAGQHIVLSLGALALSIAIAAPLGWAALRSRRFEATADVVLATIQVTPALALFGLLIPILAALLRAAPELRSFGLGAIGPAPALIGVAVYLALPLLRGLVSGLRATDPAVVESAQAMGMTEMRTTLEVRIPLGLPILMSALRVAAVQSIGLMTLGGLIGAGGLGAIVFEGMSQLASDLIILGAIPIVILALIADMGLAWLSGALVGAAR
jgi:osmoprotectant transport system permease protein